MKPGSRELALAEAGLTAVTLAAIVGLTRVFADGSFVPTVLFSAVVAHSVAIACRRLRLHPLVAALVLGAAFALVTTWQHLPETATAGLPTGETWTAGRTELRDSWRLFKEILAPAPVLPGFVLTTSIGAWLVAVAADTAAFRAGGRVEAAVPGIALFVFGGALGRGQHRVATTALFLAALLVYWLAQRARASAASPTRLGDRGATGTATILRVGGVLAAIGVAAAVVLGPQVPTADAKAAIPWRATDREDPPSRVTISPLVDIRTRIVDQANVELFRVQSPARSYWRITALERFDGRIWSSNRQYRPARGRLDTGVDVDDLDSETVEQRFTIAGLSSIWLPAAFRPVRVRDTDARYDPESNSILSETDSIAGLEYLVESELPRVDAETLGRVPAIAPDEIVETYLALPTDFSIDVRRLANQVVDQRNTQYDRARALQDFLRSDRFTYDLEVPPGHGGNELEQFLFRTRRGYCEQFAGAFAAMARSVGLPSRVAVGFTPGEQAADGTFVVRGYHGHAWPEVYLDGYGWVPFEPTPGRGIPGGEPYTGVPESQASADDQATATTVPATTTTAAAAPGGGSATTTTLPVPGQALDDQESEPFIPVSVARTLAAAAALLIGGPVVWVATLAVARLVRRRRRRSRAAAPDARVLVAWDEAAEALARTGTVSHPAETASEFAGRAVADVPAAAGALHRLAMAVTAAIYGRDRLSAAEVGDALEAAATVERAATAVTTRKQRLRDLVDPRPLLPAAKNRVEVRDVVTRARRA